MSWKDNHGNTICEAYYSNSIADFWFSDPDDGTPPNQTRFWGHNARELRQSFKTVKVIVNENSST